MATNREPHSQPPVPSGDTSVNTGPRMNDEEREDLARRLRLQAEIRARTKWLSAKELDVAQLDRWKRSLEVFCVVHEQVTLYPAYQFMRVDGQLLPRPAIAAILKALQPTENVWSIAAWFVFANARLVERDARGERNMSPVEALERGLDDLVMNAAEMNHRGYVA